MFLFAYRLIQNAEMMKTSLSKDEEGEHLASIMFVKNNCSRIDFTPKSVEVFEKMNKIFFQNSKLRIYSGKPNPKENKTLLKINKFFLPKIDSNRKLCLFYQTNLFLIYFNYDFRSISTILWVFKDIRAY